jgi:polysaccharide chain length determinant protein (PEP-CTERM system associated)
MKELNLAIEMIIVYLQGIWLRRRYIVITAWVVCPLGWLFVMSLPPTFQASTKVYVETQSVLAPILRGLALQTDSEQQIQLMARTLLSKPTLEKIARATDMDISAKDSQDYENLISSLQKDIKLSSSGRENIYVISYAHSSPDVAKRLVQETLNTFMEGKVGNAAEDKRKTSQFLEEQIADYEKRLTEAEKRLSDFKKQQMTEAPMSEQGFYSRIEAEKSRVEATTLELRQLRSQYDSVQKQLKGEEPLLNSNLGTAGAIATQYDERINFLRQQLDGLLIRYTDKHPDVIETRKVLASLEDLRSKELEQLTKAVADGSGGNVALAQNQVYQEMRLNASRLENEIAAAQVKLEDAQSKLNTLQLQMNIIPDIEARFAGLNRDYEITKGKFEELLSRRESIELSQRADESEQDVQFRIIEPPYVPLKPSGPPRVIFYTVVLVLGVGLGVFMAFVRSQLQPVVTSALQLKTICDFPVFGLVSHTNKSALLKQSKLHLLYFLLLSGALLFSYMMLITNELVFGIETSKLLGRIL